MTCLFIIVCPVVPFSATPIICLDDFATLWLVYALLYIALIDIQDPMSYREESSISFAFFSMSCILLNSAVIPLHNTSFCKDGCKAAMSCLLNE